MRHMNKKQSKEKLYKNKKIKGMCAKAMGHLMSKVPNSLLLGPYIPAARESEDWRGSSCEETTVQQVTHRGHLPTDHSHLPTLSALVPLEY